MKVLASTIVIIPGAGRLKSAVLFLFLLGKRGILG